MVCVHPGQGKGGHLRAGLAPESSGPSLPSSGLGPGSLPPLSCAAMLSVVGVATTTAVGVIGGFWSWVVALAWAHCPGSP